MPGPSLVFKSSLNDTDFANGLKRMEGKASASGKKIGEGLNGGGARVFAGGVRAYGDVLDVVTGRYGGVLKLNAAVHGLGLSLGTAFAGVGLVMLGERVYEDTEKVRMLNFELNKVRNLNFGPAQSSLADLGKTLDEAQKIKEEFAEQRGAKPGQSKLSAFGRTSMNMAADVLDVTSWRETLNGRTHAEKQKEGETAAQAEQQLAAKSIGEKMRQQVEIQAMIIRGDTMQAALKKEELETDERIGAVRRRAITDGIDAVAIAQAELDLSKQREQILKGQTFQQKFAAAHAYEAVHVAENDKSNDLDRQTAEKRRTELERHLTLRQQRNLLQNDVNDQLGQAKGAEHSLLRRSEIRARIGDDINQARELAAQRSMMSPHERNQQSRNERRMQRAADAAERRITRGMSPEARKSFRAQQDALKGAVKNNATIDDGSITKLTNAIRDAVNTLIAK